MITRLFFLAAILVLGFVYSRGFIPHDEGWILHPAQRITQGQLPYRDFHYIYTPGVAYFIAFVFKLFGPSIVVSRAATLIIALSSVWLIWSIGQKIAPKSPLVFLSAAIYLTWGPMHLNFAWPVIYAIWSGLLTCWLLLSSHDKHNRWVFFLSGITTGLTFLFKQNFGLALLATNFTYFFTSPNKRDILWHIAGLVLLTSIFAIHLLATRSFFPFVSDMNFFLIQQIWTKGMQATPFIYPGHWYEQLTKTLFYLLPLFISVLSVIAAARKNKSLIFIGTFGTFYYLTGIRPTTDYLHLAPLVAASSLSWLLMLRHKPILIPIALILISLGAYRSLFTNYYRWNPKLVTQNYSLNNPRLGILVDNISQSVITQIKDYFDQNTHPGDYAFIYSFSPSFYLLTNTKNPTRFIFSPPNLLSPADELEMVSSLTEKKVKEILTDRPLDNSTPTLTSYITSYYSPEKTIRQFTLWHQK